MTGKLSVNEEETIISLLARQGVVVRQVDRGVWKDRYNERAANLDHLSRNLIDFKHVMDAHQVPFLLGQGTLLAAARDGAFFPHSVDCDLYVYWADRERFAAAARELVSLGFEAIRLYRKEGLRKITFERDEEIIDVKFAEARGWGWWRYWQIVLHRFPFRYFGKTGELSFLGESFLVPGDYPGYLRRRYGPLWHDTVFKLQASDWFSHLAESLDRQNLLVSVEFPFWPLTFLKFRTIGITRAEPVPVPGSMVLFAAGERPCLRYIVDSRADGSVRLLGGSRAATARWWPRSQVLARATHLRLKNGLVFSFDGWLIRSLLRVVARIPGLGAR
jgi:hypothetical protein